MFEAGIKAKSLENLYALIIREVYLVCAMTAGFVSFPQYKIFIAFCLLLSSRLIESLMGFVEVCRVQERRFNFFSGLILKRGLIDIKNNPENDWIDSTEFWQNVQREAMEEVRSEDRISLADQELGFSQKPRFISTALGAVVFDLVVLAVAWGTSYLILST